MIIHENQEAQEGECMNLSEIIVIIKQKKLVVMLISFMLHFTLINCLFVS